MDPDPDRISGSGETAIKIFQNDTSKFGKMELRCVNQVSENIIKLDICVQVRNRWLRLLETMGCRSATMTGASNSSATSSEAGANGGNSYQHGGGSRGRGRGGQNRGSQRGAGGGVAATELWSSRRFRLPRYVASSVKSIFKVAHSGLFAGATLIGETGFERQENN